MFSAFGTKFMVVFSPEQINILEVEETDFKYSFSDRKSMKHNENNVSDKYNSLMFKKWFGDSKVVDSNGNPLKVYHGTTKDFSKFSDETKGSRTNHNKEDVGYHFTNDPSYADVYASTSTMKGYMTYVEMFPNEADDVKHNIRTSNIMPVYLRIEKPYYIPNAKIDKSVIDEALENGCDGIIGKLGDTTKEYVVFSPNQIKSAVGNKGNYNIDSDDINESKPNMKHIKTFEQLFENQPAYMSNAVGYYSKPVGYMIKGSELEEEIVDYSGEYSTAYEFIVQNNLEDKFTEINGDYRDEDMEDFGEYVSYFFDEEVIEGLLPKDYKVIYNEQEDLFYVSKKKKKIRNFKPVIKIAESTEEKEKIEEKVNEYVLSEYEGRIGVYYKDELIGGSTYTINDETVYVFDVAVDEKYQSNGVFKSLIEHIKDDAKNLGCESIKAEVVNYELSVYMENIGFNVERNKDYTYAYLVL